MAGWRRAASQQEPKPPPEMVITQRSVLQSGFGAYQSMYGRRKSSALNPGISFSPVFAAIWCGWTSGIFPSGQMYVRSYGFAEGVNGPNDARQKPVTSTVTTRTLFRFMFSYPFV